MALFFLVMGLELKRELLVGELSAPEQAMLPIIAALGGMLVPALCYVALNSSGVSLKGWAIPMATDIAFAIGALSLLGPRIPRSLITFLIALAIVDDLGAVMVIAFFYTETISWTALGYGALLMLVLVALNLGGIRRALPYAAVGVALWLAMLASGVHATIAGILLAFTIPIRPKYEPGLFVERVQDATREMQKAGAENPDIIHNTRLRSLIDALGNGVQLVQAPAQRMETRLHLPVAYIIIPVFALANAGIPMSFANPGRYFDSTVLLGICAGLLLGKPLGIAGFSWIAVKLGWARLPEGLRFAHIVGVGFLGGIGFTMAIFIADLGFANASGQLLMAKTGILLASLLSGLIGVFLLLSLDVKRTDA
jgi:NhaA family Na+:H+ antiporter